jgi:hypothetical protein
MGLSLNPLNDSSGVLDTGETIIGDGATNFKGAMTVRQFMLDPENYILQLIRLFDASLISCTGGRRIKPSVNPRIGKHGQAAPRTALASVGFRCSIGRRGSRPSSSTRSNHTAPQKGHPGADRSLTCQGGETDPIGGVLGNRCALLTINR